jgi:hypothetical protein
LEPTIVAHVGIITLASAMQFDERMVMVSAIVGVWTVGLAIFYTKDGLMVRRQ